MGKPIRTLNFTPPLRASELGDMMKWFPAKTHVRGVDAIEVHDDGLHFVQHRHVELTVPKIATKRRRKPTARIEGGDAA